MNQNLKLLDSLKLGLINEQKKIESQYNDSISTIGKAFEERLKEKENGYLSAINRSQEKCLKTLKNYDNILKNQMLETGKFLIQIEEVNHRLGGIKIREKKLKFYLFMSFISFMIITLIIIGYFSIKMEVTQLQNMKELVQQEEKNLIEIRKALELNKSQFMKRYQVMCKEI